MPHRSTGAPPLGLKRLPAPRSSSESAVADPLPAAAGQSGDPDYDSDSSDGHWQLHGPDDDDDDDDYALTLGNTWRLNFTLRKVYVSKATSLWDFLVDLVWNTSMVTVIFVDPECGEDSSIM